MDLVEVGKSNENFQNTFTDLMQKLTKIPTTNELGLQKWIFLERVIDGPSPFGLPFLPSTLDSTYRVHLKNFFLSLFVDETNCFFEELLLFNGKISIFQTQFVQYEHHQKLGRMVHELLSRIEELSATVDRNSDV